MSRLPKSAIETIETWRLGFVATASLTGEPNLSPKGTFIVIDDQTIAFGEMRSPNTVRNLETNSELEINFVDILTRKGVRIRGQAEMLDKRSEAFETLYPRFVEIWGPELCAMFNRIVKIPIGSVKPLQSPIYELDGDAQTLKAMWQDKIGDM